MALANPPIIDGFDTNETNTQDISASQKTDGYATNEIPLSENHGFMFNQFYKWLNYLKSAGISQWDVNVSYSKHARIMRDGIIYKSKADANQGNDPLSTSDWDIDQWRFQTVTHNMTADSDYPLTAEQNTYGRIVITDTNPFLTVARNIIVDNAQRTFIVQNDTLQKLTFKTSAGTGVIVESGGFPMTLYCDGTNVIYVSGAITTKAYRDTTQSTTVATNTKLAINNVEHDTMDLQSVNKITPKVAGYYRVSGQVSITTTVDGHKVSAMIYKNGVNVSASHEYSTKTAAIPLTPRAITTVFCDGVSDFLELYYFDSQGGNTINTGIVNSYLIVEKV